MQMRRGPLWSALRVDVDALTHAVDRLLDQVDERAALVFLNVLLFLGNQNGSHFVGSARITRGRASRYGRHTHERGIGRRRPSMNARA